MKIGIDISQTAYKGTGVARYVKKLVEALLKLDKENQYILFFSSMRGKLPDELCNLEFDNLEIKKFVVPSTLLSFLWNDLHILPIELFVGDVDVFISSDWTQPPVRRAKMMTVVHDLSPWKVKKEMDKKIVRTHKKRMKWVRSECEKIIADSISTKKDLVDVLNFDERKIKVVYPGAD